MIRCNWERKGGREPLARVTVLRERHTCLNAHAIEPAAWDPSMPPGLGENHGLGGQTVGVAVMGPGGMREDAEGNIVGGARVLGGDVVGGPVAVGVGVLPKVQRNSASRLPFLMDILPRLMRIEKETTPNEIRECLLREFGAEVHLQQCRRAKTEILKKREEREAGNGAGNGNGGPLEGLVVMEGKKGDGGGPSAQQQNGMQQGQQLLMEINGGSDSSPIPFALHAAAGVVTPAAPERASAALMAVGEPPVRCPYCINHRWMSSIKDAVEHMSMHVTV